MKHIAVAAIVAAFALHAGLVHADTSTAPGQQKKEAGAQSAKEYAPGQKEDHGKAKAKAKRKAETETEAEAEHGKKAEKGGKKPDVAAPAPVRGKKK